MNQHDASTHQSTGESGDSVMTRDPVCGMQVDPATAEHRHGHAE